MNNVVNGVRAGFFKAVTPQRSSGWADSEVGAAADNASAYAEALHDACGTRSATLGTELAFRFGRWYGERLLFDRAQPSRGNCLAMIDKLVAAYSDLPE